MKIDTLVGLATISVLTALVWLSKNLFDRTMSALTAPENEPILFVVSSLALFAVVILIAICSYLLLTIVGSAVISIITSAIHKL
jgi:uncharacterized membrane protein